MLNDIKTRERGFTFIELIIAITIFSIIAVSIYSVFRSGFMLWYRVSPMIQSNQSLRFFFNTVSSDLKNAIPYAKEDVNFEGSHIKMSFITLVEVAGSDIPVHMEPARVVYYLDNTRKAVRRSVATKAEGLSEDHARTSDILNDVEDKNFGFEYCYRMGSSKTEYDYEWRKEWEDKDSKSGKIPRGVKIKAGEYTKIIFIPTGKLGGEDAVQ